MSDTPSRQRISEAALLVRNAGYPDVCKWMLARDKKQAHTPTKRKRKMAVALHGHPVRGGKVFIDLSNVDIVGENHF